MALPAGTYANLLAGIALLSVAVALLARSRDRAARLLGLYLALTGARWLLLPLNRFVGEPALAQAIVNTAYIPLYFAPMPLILFASEFAGRHRALWSHPAALAAMLALPVGLTALELALPNPLWVRPPGGGAIRGEYGAWWSLFLLLLLAATAYAVALVGRSLARETDPSKVPVRALLLAAFIVPAAMAGRNALIGPGHWEWLGLLGLPVPAMLPDAPGLGLVLALLLALLPLGLLRDTASTRAREAGLAGVALGAMLAAAVGVAAEAPEDVTQLRWVFFALLVTYAGLRHGLLGSRRVLSPAVELPLAAAGFGVLAVLFAAMLTPVLAEWMAVTLGLALALVASALTITLSGTPLGVPQESRYREERELGRGATGRAVLALDRRLHRAVVLKRLPVGAAGAALREARAAAHVSHPSLVSVYDVVEDGAGASLVLEYMPGGTLEHRLEKGPLPVAEARRLGLQLAEGLGALHAAGLVHGDIKASNVFFRADGRAALGDFGAARPARTVEATAESLARQPVAGSLAGAAPEVLRGKVPDARSDLYALGALLYRAFTGESYVPFPVDFERGRLAVLTQPPRLPHPRVPARWEALLARCLAKDPRQRPASARELAEALERVEG